MRGLDGIQRVWRLLASSMVHRSLRQNQPMPDFDQLTDDELLARAHEWRRRAMHGDKDARGMAHALERESRRRLGNPASAFALLDTRPLAARQQKPWWQFW